VTDVNNNAHSFGLNCVIHQESVVDRDYADEGRVIDLVFSAKLFS